MSRIEELQSLKNYAGVRAVGDIQKISLNDGDTVVLMTEKFLTPDQRAAVNHYLCDILPKNKVIIADGGFKVGVLGNDERLDRIEQRLDAIAELLAVLLDSVQQEDVEQNK